MTEADKGKKAIFFDIDGTLINIMAGQTRLSPKVEQAIAKLHRAGHYTFIASGRPAAFLDPQLTESGLFDGFVLMNGAAVLLHGKMIAEHPLPRETVQAIVRLCDEHDVEYVLQGPEHVYLKPEYHWLENFFTSIDIPMERFIRHYDLHDVDVCKMEFRSEYQGGRGIFARLMNWPGLTGLIDPYHKKNMELYASSITKGSGIRDVLSYLHLPQEASYAFGDGLNDIDMMEAVGTRLVMDNARPALKELADYIVPSVDDDGVAAGIERYVLA